MMKKHLLAAACALAALSAHAGGILTNTNQNIAFNRMMSREASIGIDGVYSNPAGVAFMAPGDYISLNWQMPWQTRTIKSAYPLYQNNAAAPAAEKTFKGHAYCPFIPSIQYVHNTQDGKWSFQANFSIGGAGGKCQFDDGLGSLERTVANTAFGLATMAQQLDAAQRAAGLPATNLPQMFPGGKYSYDGYMDGQQFYWGLSVGAAYKFNEHLAAFVGVRGVYASCQYKGHVSAITVDGLPMSALLGGNADISLDCDQTGWGVTPIVGIDYKTGRWNFSARYEFMTRIRLKNTSDNHVPDLDMQALGQTLVEKGGVHPAVLANPQVQAQLAGFKGQFEAALDETLGEFEDGASIKADIPALLTLGAGYAFTDKVRANVGFHWFDDRHASLYAGREKKLDHGTIEFNAGVEWDATRRLTVSCGWQHTGYGMADDYMEDRSFSVNSNSFGLGACIHATKHIDVNVAYFGSFYDHYNKEAKDNMTQQPYTEDYTRTNHVAGVGVNYTF